MAKVVPDLRVVTEQDGKAHAGQAAHNGQQTDRDVELARAHRVERVNRHVRAQAGVDRMPKAEHAALAQQHVVGKASDDGNAHLRQHGGRQVAGEHEG
jgi:hypothetical protein